MVEDLPKPPGTSLKIVDPRSFGVVVSSVEVATAREFPRSVTTFKERSRSMATLSTKIASECIYALPRREQGVVKMIKGASIRLAEIVTCAWGNCRSLAWIHEEGREIITARGVFIDLEYNNGIGIEAQRRIVNRYGQRYSTDMIVMTGNAASSIALRNAIFHGVPRALWWDVYEDALKIVAGDAKTLVDRRADVMGFLHKQGATDEQIFAVLGVRGLDDIGIEEVATLTGIANAIRDGELTVDEAFKPQVQAPTGVAGAKEVLSG
jgi:hypothetical protein